VNLVLKGAVVVVTITTVRRSMLSLRTTLSLSKIAISALSRSRLRSICLEAPVRRPLTASMSS
jgi:hypothetical protein